MRCGPPTVAVSATPAEMEACRRRVCRTGDHRPRGRNRPDRDPTGRGAPGPAPRSDEWSWRNPRPPGAQGRLRAPVCGRQPVAGHTNAAWGGNGPALEYLHEQGFASIHAFPNIDARGARSADHRELRSARFRGVLVGINLLSERASTSPNARCWRSSMPTGVFALARPLPDPSHTAPTRRA